MLADNERPIHRDIVKAVASWVRAGGDALLLQAVDLDDSGPYEIPKPRAITALESYIPPRESEELLHELAWLLLTPPLSDLQTNRLRRITDIVSNRPQARAEVKRVAARGVEKRKKKKRKIIA